MVAATVVDTVDTKTLRELVRAGSVRRAYVVADGDRFRLVLRYGNEARLLEAAKGHVRRFRALDSVASYLLGIGVVDFEVNTAHWRPRTVEHIGVET